MSAICSLHAENITTYYYILLHITLPLLHDYFSVTAALLQIDLSLLHITTKIFPLHYYILLQYYYFITSTLLWNYSFITTVLLQMSFSLLRITTLLFLVITTYYYSITTSLLPHYSGITLSLLRYYYKWVLFYYALLQNCYLVITTYYWIITTD